MMGSVMKRILQAVVICCLLIGSASAATVRVAAAVSLREAATQIAADYKVQTGDEIVLSFGSSGQLAAQIQNGAMIDLFISAANTQIDQLIKSKLVDEGSRQVVAGNELVLIAPAMAKDPPSGFKHLEEKRFARIAIGSPKTVPAGEYAMQTLTAMKLADAVQDRLIYGTNVRQVLDYVERGEVAAGIVYATDAKESGAKVTVIEKADPATHKPIEYPAVVVKSSKNAAAAKKFLDYFGQEKAQKILAEKGFVTVDAKARNPKLEIRKNGE